MKSIFLCSLFFLITISSPYSCRKEWSDSECKERGDCVGFSSAFAAEMISSSAGTQWSWPKGTHIIVGSAFAPNMGGVKNLYCPYGNNIFGFAWESSIKVDAHEVLFHWMISPVGNKLGEAGEKKLISMHHVSKNRTTSHPVTIAFPHDRPLVVPAGWRIWVYADGGPGDATSATHPAPVEYQAVVYGDKQCYPQ